MHTDFSLKAYNSLQVEASAKYFLEANKVEDLINLPPESVFVLGEGCNTLFTKDWPGLVIKNNLQGREIISENADEVMIKIASGEDWHQFVSWAVENNWSGIENMAYIPGTVGAAVAGNIAAYGQAMDETLVSVETLEIASGKSKVFTKGQCALHYRHSIFQDELKGQFFITSATVRLSKTAHFATNYYSRRESLQTELQKIKPSGNFSIKDVFQAVINIRTQKLPDWRTIGTAGSFFKNPFVTQEKLVALQTEISELQAYPTTGMDYPKNFVANSVKIPAGRLLDELGWRGRRIGNVGTYDKHALVVVNYGATGQEVYEFAEMMRNDVKKNYDVTLEYEVQVV